MPLLFGPPNVGRLKARGDVKGLIKALGYSKDETVVVKAAEALGYIGDERAVQPLIGAFMGGNRKVQQAAAEALGQIGGRAAVDALVMLLREKSLSGQEEVVRALGQTQDLRAVEPLVSMLRNDRWFFTRQAAAWALGQIGDENAVEALVLALADEGEMVREAAEKALDSIDPDWRRSEAARRAIPELVMVLNSPNRWAAEKALDNIDPDWRRSEAARRAIPELVMALKDQNSGVRQAAGVALRLLNWEPKDVTQQALWLVACDEWEKAVSLGSAAVEPLRAALQHSDRWVWPQAARALVQLGDVQAIEHLIAALKLQYDFSYHEEAMIALVNVLHSRAAEIAPGDLRKLAALEVFRQVKTFEWAGGFDGERLMEDWEDVPVDCSEVRQLARQELIRRDLEP